MSDDLLIASAEEKIVAHASGSRGGDLVVILPPDPAVWAARLYAELHRLDGLGLSVIVVDEPPADEAWLAVRDRLRRAALSGGLPGRGPSP